MEYRMRKNPLFSACGLNCGLCPRYHTDGTSKCPGCAGEGFSLKHPPCGLLSCSQRRGIEYCFLCGEYPCKKYEGANLSDSFITHKNQLRNSEKAKNIGVEAYEAELNEKIKILNDLLKNFDDGRRKSFFCTAMNLLDLQDISCVINQIIAEIETESPPKTKAAIAVRLFEEMAQKRNVSLKLRKKTHP